MALCCDDPIDGEVKRSEHWSYVGQGRGAYETVSDVVFVGHGKGSIQKEVKTEKRPTNAWPCIVAIGLIFLLLVGIFLIFLLHRPAAAADEFVYTTTAPPPPKQIIIKHHYITQNRDKVVGYPVPGPSHVVYHKVYSPHTHFDCSTDAMNYRAWSAKHQKWCCWAESVACPTKVVNVDKYVPVTKAVPVTVPKVHYVSVRGPEPKPKIVHIKVPSRPLPPKVVKEPVPVRGERPPAHIHYKYVPVAHPVKVPKVVYDTKVVKEPVAVKKYVPKVVHEPPKIIHKTHIIYDHHHEYDCVEGFHDYKHLWSTPHREYCCWKESRGCPGTHEEDHLNVVTHTKYIDVPVPSPPKVVIRHHKIVKTSHHEQRHFNCHAGYSNWYFGWSKTKQDWCCAHESRGCEGTWKGHMHVHASMGASIHAAAAGAGKATGTIYDCDAGYSNWEHGWSDSKKLWCCEHHEKGCADHHCYHGEPDDWSEEKSQYCCGHFQRGCPHTTISPLGCQAPCTHGGHTSVCKERITWAEENHFSGRSNACALAYSQVQVECDICRGCTIEAAGCEVHVATSEAFDCDAALNNFFRAWSPPKKHWCCSVKGKGCEGAQPPAVDPGAGMVWKHVQVNGYWTWVAVTVSGGGAVVASLPYDCHVGLANWHIGWCAPKKTWCCANQKMGCEGAAGGGAAGGAGHFHTHTEVHVFHGGAAGGAAGGAGFPPGAAGQGMEWKWENDGGHWHWGQIHMEGSPKYDCRAGLAKFKTGWSTHKTAWCCHFEGLGCA